MTKKKKGFDKKTGTTKNESVQDSKAPDYMNYVFFAILLAIFALSFYIRAVMPYDSVFRGGVVAFASDDAVYQMRLVENTLYNFPYRAIYDPFTEYPVGARGIHFGPLFTLLIATASLIAGFGSYNMQTVNTIGAYVPAFFGALVVFPVYFIGRNLGGRGTGLLAALMIAILPGQFFSRSLLGFTDHHVNEVFFSTATMAFFILALKAGREKNATFSDIGIRSKPLIFSISAGIMLGAFQLTWAGAPFFAMIIAIFILIQYIIDDMRGRSTDYIAMAAVPMFLIDFIFVLPFFNPENGFASFVYSWFHVLVPLGGAGLPVALSIISKELKKRGFKAYHYPVVIGGFFVLGMLVVGIILPPMYSTIVNAPRLIFEQHKGGPNTVAEASPIFEKPGYFWSNFPITGSLQGDNMALWFMIAVLLAIGYRIARKVRPEDMLLLVWSIVMLLAVIGQNRWAYYFAVNVALLVGYAGGAISEYVLKLGGWNWQIDAKSIGVSHLLSLALVVTIVIFFAYPSANATTIGENPLARWGGGEPSPGLGFTEWHETLTWMRDNTPDPGLDYLAKYGKPENSTYPYPDTAYGVMSWWDYGHIITYWAHRIPNANPFQAGIGGGESHRPGAATFLVATSEDEANNVLYALGINGKPGSRYIISNAYMAFQIMGVFGIWNNEYDLYTQIRTNEGMQTVPSMKYYEVMEAKLHIFDGNGLKRYRLVHESARNPYGDEQGYKNIYNILYGGNVAVENSGLVKIFEFVKGATITGRAPANASITLTNTIKTNIGRTFRYSQTTTASGDGTYAITVPYSTTGPITGETNFNTQPEGRYTITAGNVTKQVEVSEKAVLEGGTVTVDL